jgi:cardiolipin synthase (CMP-forming)
VSLWFVGQLPFWLVALVILRDLLIVIGFVVIHTTAAPKQFDPIYISKINTLIQLILIGFVLAQGLGIESEAVKWLLVAAAALTTVLSGLSYLARWARILAGSEQAS